MTNAAYIFYNISGQINTLKISNLISGRNINFVNVFYNGIIKKIFLTILQIIMYI